MRKLNPEDSKQEIISFPEQNCIHLPRELENTESAAGIKSF